MEGYTNGETFTRLYVRCPSCGESDWTVDHLREGIEAGPWECEACHVNHFFVVKEGKVLVKADGPAPRSLALLRLGDLFLVVRLYVEHTAEHMDYLVHSHQCPTNLLRSVKHAFDYAGEDPHGRLRLVGVLPDDTETRGKLEQCDSLQALFVVYETDGQPLPSEWPEEDRGVLPGLAAMQREARKKGDA